MLNFRTAGKVVFVASDQDGAAIREGSRVNGPDFKGDKGQLLVQLDDEQQLQDLKMSQTLLEEARHQLLVYKNEFKKYDLQFAMAETQLDRVTMLYNKSILSLTEFESEKMNYQETQTIQCFPPARSHL